MGKRERKNWDLPWSQSVVLIILSVLFFLGGVAGCLFAGLADADGAQKLGAYLVDYLTLAGEGTVTRSFWLTLWEQFRYLLGAALLGITAIGVIGIPVLFCIRGFLFSFSVACLMRTFAGAGIVPAMVLFGIPALLWAPGLFLVGTQGLSSAQSLLRRGLGDGRSALPFTLAYWIKLGVGGILVILCGCLEYMIIPVLLRYAAHVVL